MAAVFLPPQTLKNYCDDRVDRPQKPANDVAAAAPTSKSRISAEEQATKELEIAMMKKYNVHIGQRKTCPSPQMKPYLSHDDDLDIDIIDLEKTWEGLAMAARAVVAIENPKHILVASDIMLINRDIDVPEMVQFFAHETKTEAFTRESYSIRSLPPHKRPKLVILTYPKTDYHRRLIKAAHFAEIPMIAFCEIDCPMEFVNDATTIIPADCNETAVSCLFWILLRMVLQMRGPVYKRKRFDELLWYEEDEEQIMYEDLVRTLEDPVMMNRVIEEYTSGLKNKEDRDDEEEECWEAERENTESEYEDDDDEEDYNWEVVASEECEVVEASEKCEVVVVHGPLEEV